MIEEQAQVVAIDNSMVWVEAQRKSSCSRCAANKGCGNAVFQKLFGDKQNVFPVSSNDKQEALSVNVGDEVIIGIEENALVKNSFVVYAIPILSILIFAAIGETFANNSLSISNDLASLSGALVGLVISIVGLRFYDRLFSNKPGSQPVLLRRVSGINKLSEVKILS